MEINPTLLIVQTSRLNVPTGGRPNLESSIAMPEDLVKPLGSKKIQPQRKNLPEGKP